MSTDISTSPIPEFFATLYKHKQMITKLVVITGAMILIITLLMAPRYLVFSEVLLDVEDNKITVATPPAGAKSLVLDLTNRISLEKALIQGPIVLRAVATKYPDLKEKLNRDEVAFRRWFKEWFANLFSSAEEDPEKKIYAQIRFLSKKLDVSQVPNSNIIKISILAADPVFGMQLLDDLVEAYRTHRSTIQRFPEAPTFYDDRIAESKQRLQDLESRLNRLQEEHRIIDFEKEISRTMTRIEALDQKIAEIKAARISAEQKLAEIKANLRRGFLNIAPSLDMTKEPFLTKIYDKRTELKLALLNLTQKYRADDPQVQLLNNEIKKVESQLQQEVNRIISLNESAVERLKAEERALQAVMADLRQQLQTLPEIGTTMSELRRDIQNETVMLTSLAQRRTQELVAAASDSRIVSLRTVTPATYLRKKAAPQRLLYLGVGLFLALAAGIGLALLREYFNQTFKTEQELEKSLGVPVLGSLYEVRDY